jgi:hypothetical protein
MMNAVVNYTIFSNVCFTTAYFLPESMPLWFLPRLLLVDYLLAIGIATGVHFMVLPTTSRTVFLVYSLVLSLILGVLCRVLDLCVVTFAHL